MASECPKGSRQLNLLTDLIKFVPIRMMTFSKHNMENKYIACRMPCKFLLHLAELTSGMTNRIGGVGGGGGGSGSW